MPYDGKYKLLNIFSILYAEIKTIFVVLHKTLRANLQIGTIMFYLIMNEMVFYSIDFITWPLMPLMT